LELSFERQKTTAAANQRERREYEAERWNEKDTNGTRMEGEDGEEKRREEDEKKERGEKEREVTGRTDVAGVGRWLVSSATVAGVRLVRRHRPDFFSQYHIVLTRGLESQSTDGFLAISRFPSALSFLLIPSTPFLLAASAVASTALSVSSCFV
jgi:hypothetical protein